MESATKNWLNIAKEDYEVAGQLFKNKKYLYCLFFCQQAMEKVLKAIYHENYKETPPRKHDLMDLAESSGILPELKDEQKDLFVTLTQFYIESRYTEDREELAKNSTREVTKEMLDQTGVVFKWLKSKLK